MTSRPQTRECDDLVKLSSVTINKIINLKYMKLAFNKSTSINGKGASAQGLQTIKEAIRFVLDCSDLKPQKLLFSNPDANAMEDDDDSFPFVAAEIITNGRNQEFKKEISNNEITYLIDKKNCTRDAYRNALFASNVIPPTLETLIIDPQRIDKVTVMTETKRAPFIEKLCGSQEVLTSYNNLSSLTEKAKLDIDASQKRQKMQMAERKKLKKSVEDSGKRKQFGLEYDHLSKEHDLFRLYHNNQFLLSSDDRLEELATVLSEVESKKTDHLEVLQAKAAREDQLEAEIAKLKNQLLKESNALQDIQRKHYLTEVNVEGCEAEESLDGNLQREALIIQQNIDRLNGDIEKLGQQLDLRESIQKKHEQYEKLRKSFEVENGEKLLEISSLKSKIADENISKEIHENINKLLDLGDEEDLAIEIDGLQVQHREKLQKQNEIDGKILELKKLSEFISDTSKTVVQEEIERNEKISEDTREKIITELKRKFPKQVMGRIASLLTSNMGEAERVLDETGRTSDEILKAHLGKYVNAIIVDTKETAELCFLHLKTKKMLEIDEIFLPLSEIQQISTLDVLDGQLPTLLPCDVIDSLVKAHPEEIRKVLMFCLKPSLFFKSLEDAETAITWEACQKVDVMSTVRVFKKTGTLEAVPIFEETPDNKITVEDEKNLMKLKCEVETNLNLKAKLQEEINYLKMKVEAKTNLNMKLQFKRDFRSFADGILKDQDGDSKTDLKAQLDRMLTELQEEESKHFKVFCADADVENAQEYLERYYDSMAQPGKKIELLKADTERQEKEKSLLEFNIGFDSKEKDLNLQKLNEIASEMNAKESEINEVLEKACTKMEEYFEAEEELKQGFSLNEEIRHQTRKTVEEISNERHQKEMSLKENYEILSENFMKHVKIPLSAGTVQDFFMTPENAAENYKFVDNKLERIQVNFDGLKSTLKEIDDVNTKVYKFKTKLEKLHSKVEKITGNLQEEVSEQRIQRITSELRTLKTTVNKHKALFDKLDLDLQKVKQERKTIFEESLKTLNEGLKEFCFSVYGPNVLGELVPSNQNEPYLGDVSFYWRTEDGPDNRILGSGGNVVSSLALLLAIVKQKKQRLVILDNVSKKITENVDAFFTRQNDVQIISLTSQINDEKSTYIIRPAAQGFTAKRLRVS